MKPGDTMQDIYKTKKPLPYGLANYDLVVRQNCFYVDKTMYLEEIENAGNYLFFIRPRRFGKSLFLSMMEAYYDLYYQDRFEELFKGTAVFDSPTRERSMYMVLSFNFSAVEPAQDKVETSFLNHIRSRTLAFLRKYPDHLPKEGEYFKKIIRESRSGADIISVLLDLYKDSPTKLYIIIDEYDNFANTILSVTGEESYELLTHGEGFFRSFFNVLKVGTTGAGAPVTRLFITGVSPVTLDDLTSGFNIGENISIDSTFNRMLGFSRTDVQEMLDYYKTAGLIKHDPQYLLDILTGWYDNYLFSEHAPDSDRLLNPDMALYFLKEYIKIQAIPDDLIDRNVRIDYSKLRHLIITGNRVKERLKEAAPNGNFHELKKIIEEGGTLSTIAPGFPLEKLTDSKNFKSLLFYLGLLTIKGPVKDKLRLVIPNETVKRLYYDYIEGAYREMNIFDLDLSRYSDLMTDMAYDGKWLPLIDFITGRMRESMSLRDLITGEKSIQAFLNVYLGLSNLYIIHTEKELNKGYADIVLEPFLARYAGIKYSYLLEIKYTKAGRKPGDAEVQKLKAEAGVQLKQYSMNGKSWKSFQKTTLIKLVLIFSGHDLVHREGIPMLI